MENPATLPLLVAFGIPTVDYSFLVSDKSVIEKYELNLDSQRELSMDILDFLKLECHKNNYKFKKLAGGNCSVSLIVFQNLLHQPYQTVMCGAVGNDDNGLFVQKYLTNRSIITNFDVIEKKKTANCVVAIHKDLRTIAVTNGVGSDYCLRLCPNIKQKIDLATSSMIVLFEGFFVAFSYDVALPVIQKCKRSGTIVALNISGVYILEHFASEFLSCWKQSDILIGNMSEFNALCNVLQLSSKSLHERLKTVQKKMISKRITNSSKLESKNSWKKILIVTNNKEPIYCIYGDNILIEYCVPPVQMETIVDTCGAGDSFLGGFLYALVKQNPIEKCLEFGCLVSSKIIQTHGYDL